MSNRGFYIKQAAIFVVVATILTFLYAWVLRAEIDKNALKTIVETARHDRAAIAAFIEFYLGNLEGIKRRLDARDFESLAKLREGIKLEADTTRFSGLFLIREDGEVFGDGEANPGLSQTDFAGFKDSDSLVFRLDDAKDGNEISRDALAFALRMDNFEAAGTKFDAIAGLADTRALRDYLIIYSFVRDGEANGFSSIIDESGAFIVGGPKRRREGNFFSWLANASAPFSKREIQIRMRDSESFHFYMEDNARENLVYLAPFRLNGVPSNWYFLMSVDNAYLERSGGMFLILSATLPALAILLTLAMLIYGIAARNQARAAREAARTRTDFLSYMSHEIRTPLNGALGLNYLISKNIDDPEKLPKIKGWLAKARSLDEYLLSLLSDVLDMSRLRSNGLEVSREKYSVAKMTGDLVFMHEASAESKDIRIILHQKVRWPKIIGDEERARRILTNILDNAIKFSSEGGIITLNVSQKKLGDGKVMTVWRCSDSGAGISKESLEKIFNPFGGDEASRVASLKGAGMGLPISRELAHAMGGDVKIESQEGKGSVVTITIPGDIPPEGEEETSVDEEVAAPEASTRKRALLVEDAEFNAEFLMDALSDAGFETTLATNGKKAIEIFANSEPGEISAIIMDMEMPVMDGCDAAREIRAMDREDAKNVPIVACTANAFQDDKNRALESGMDDFLTKPVDIEKLANKLRRLASRTAGRSGDGKGGAAAGTPSQD